MADFSKPLIAKLNDPDRYIQADELDLIERLLPLKGARVLELGCGRAWMTRRLAQNYPLASLVAMEVDHIQYEINMAISDLPGVDFRYGGMEAIPLDDETVDIVIMLKSLHHVPMEMMDQGFAELKRVLRPGGLVYISEPVFAGEFNEILRLFNDEQLVREAAFAALRRSVESGGFVHEAQHFFQSHGCYANWEEFEDRMLKVTHTKHKIDEGLYQLIKDRFLQHMTPIGASFYKPSRVDLLRKVI